MGTPKLPALNRISAVANKEHFGALCFLHRRRQQHADFAQRIGVLAHCTSEPGLLSRNPKVCSLQR